MNNEKTIIDKKDKQRYDVYKSWLVDDATFTGIYELPVLKPCYEKPKRAVPFHKSYKIKDYDRWVHFYEDLLG